MIPLYFAAKREITNVFIVTKDDIIICDPEGEGCWSAEQDVL